MIPADFIHARKRISPYLTPTPNYSRWIALSICWKIELPYNQWIVEKS